jgi:mRNA-degrading endonuclease toxin of MazEF toxin-antitoxin module
MTLSTMVLGPKVGRLNPEAVDRVDQALRFALGL